MARVRRGRRNTFEFPGVTLLFQRFMGKGGADADRGVDGVPYRVIIDGHLWQTGSTLADGAVSVSMPPGYDRFTLEIFGSSYEVTVLPTIEPLEAVATGSMKGGEHDAHLVGLKRRLELLGYDVGAVDDALSFRTDDAILRFQADEGDHADGIAGSGTREALRRALGES